jgi:hypothetical protein
MIHLQGKELTKDKRQGAKRLIHFHIIFFKDSRVIPYLDQNCIGDTTFVPNYMSIFIGIQMLTPKYPQVFFIRIASKQPLLKARWIL